MIVEIPNHGLVEFPDHMNDADVTAAIKKITQPPSFAQQTTTEGHELNWGDVPRQAALHVPESFGNLAKGVGVAALHPFDTAQTMLDAANGGLQKVLPDSVNDFMHKIAPNTVGNEEKANAVADFYKNRYGSEQGFKEALAYDPVGVMLDASTISAPFGGIATKAATKIDPIILASKGASKITPMIGNGLATVIGELGTHTGGESIKAAARAGMNGGKTAIEFADNMRGNVPIQDVLESAKDALSIMRSNRGAKYREDMAKLGLDNTVLSLEPIDTAINGVLNVKRYKGESISPTTADIQNDISGLFKHWKELTPAEYHTAEGLDAFKQALGDIRQNTQFGTPQRHVADSVYNAVKDQIVQQVPEYAKTMTDYESASRLTHEIERALSLGDKAMADTAMRKMQSLTRNNANTNYGNRLSLAKELEKNGANNLTSNLAGQALNSWAPRGMGKAIASGVAGAGAYAHSPIVFPLLALQSPRLMGEMAFKLGQGAGKLKKVGVAESQLGLPQGLLLNYMSQAGNIQDKKDKGLLLSLP